MANYRLDPPSPLTNAELTEIVRAMIGKIDADHLPALVQALPTTAQYLIAEGEARP